MKFHQLVYFMETARHEHVGRAARILAISPSAISHSIAALEEELGRQLFAREGKRILLTSHGKLLLEKASRLLGELEAIREELASDEVELGGHYRLGGAHLLSHAVLAPEWAALQAQSSRLVGEIHSLRSSQVLAGVVSGELDFGVCFSPQLPPQVHSRVLLTGQLVPAVRRGHPLSRARGKASPKLSALPATLPKSFTGIDNCETHPAFVRHGIEPRVDLVYDSYEVAVAKIRASDAWSLLPDWVVRREKLYLIEIEGWEAPYEVAAIWPRSRPLTRALSRLLDRLVEAFNPV